MMLAQYITRDQVAEFEAKGWRVMQFTTHHARYFLAYRDE